MTEPEELFKPDEGRRLEEVKENSVTPETPADENDADDKGRPSGTS